MGDFKSMLEVVDRTERLLNGHIDNVKLFLSSSELNLICEQNDEYNEKHLLSGFNIFQIVSDTYYKENFHSDIIAALLTLKEGIDRKHYLLNKFIDHLNMLNKGLNILHEYFLESHTIITREKHRIDILIKDHKTNKVIIVENKIYNAIDSPRQLPTYVDAVIKNEGVQKSNIVAIVYIPLDPKKMPDESGWTEEEKEFVNSKLVKLVCYDGTNNDLYSWLKSAISVTEDKDVKSILGQYSNLIQTLGGKIMNVKLMESFYNEVVSQENYYSTILSLKSMLDELPQYLAKKIENHFEGKLFPPFKQVLASQSVVTFPNIECFGRSFKIVIACGINGYIFKVFDENYPDNHYRYLNLLIDKMGYSNFQQSNDERTLSFNLSDENVLMSFIEEFMEKMRRLPDNLFWECKLNCAI